MLDICIISAAHPSMNPRVVKEADALTAAGYKVGLIAPDFSAWAREADKEFEGRAWKVIERPQFGPLSPPVLRAAELARRATAGFAVKHLGSTHPAVVRAASHPVAPALVEAAKRHRARLYLAHLVAALPAAAIAARHHNALYAFDAEDFHPGDLADRPENAAAGRMVRLIEGRYLPGCAYTTAASPGIADAYSKEYGIARPTVVLNAFPRSRASSSPVPRGVATPGPSIYWFSQTIGPGRGLECAVDAIAKSSARPHLYIRGTPAQGYVSRLLDRTENAQVRERIHVLPPAPPNEMERLASVYDIGYSGEAGLTPNNRIALGNKLFSYLLAGIPMLLSSSPGHVAFVGELGPAAATFLTDDPLSLSQALDAWLLDGPALARARQYAWRLGQERFNWEQQSQTLVRLVKRVLPMPSDAEMACSA